MINLYYNNPFKGKITLLGIVWNKHYCSIELLNLELRVWKSWTSLRLKG